MSRFRPPVASATNSTAPRSGMCAIARARSSSIGAAAAFGASGRVYDGKADFAFFRPIGRSATAEREQPGMRSGRVAKLHRRRLGRRRYFTGDHLARALEGRVHHVRRTLNQRRH